jgi:predicted nucleotidyltransferase component of viral defense system
LPSLVFSGSVGTPLRKLLAFKGGTALKRCYFGGYRFSEDLDFSLVEEESFSYILKELEPRYRKLWDIRLASQMAELPHFDEAIRAVRRSMRAAQFSIQG